MSDVDFRFTPRVLCRVRSLVRAGLSGPRIAATLGCNYKSLRTVCSRHGISLRLDADDLKEALLTGPRPVRLLGRSGRPTPLGIELGAHTLRGLREHAARLKTSDALLAAKLLELTIAGGLVGAVLDGD